MVTGRPLLLFPWGQVMPAYGDLLVLAVQRSVSYVTQGWVTQTDSACRNPTLGLLLLL